MPCLGPAMSQLPEREQRILRMRFVEGLTQSEIATSIGVSQMHVSRLLAASLAGSCAGTSVASRKPDRPAHWRDDFLSLRAPFTPSDWSQ